MNRVHLGQIDLNLLVVLDELLRSRSTTVAARRLGRTQSAVSHALARLRATLKDPLLVRVGASLVPTAVAEEMHPALRDVLAGAEALVTRSRLFDPSRLERTFVIGGTDFAEIVIMPRLVPRLRVEAPGVTVVSRALGENVDHAVQSREVDLAFGTSFRPLAGMLEDKVADEELIVLLRRDHPAAKRLTVRSYAALDHILVAPRGLPGSPVDQALEPLGVTRRVVLRLQHFAAAALIVAQTDLVVTLPARFARQMAETLPLRTAPLPFDVAGFTFSVAYNASVKDDPAHRWFRGRVVEAARGEVTA